MVENLPKAECLSYLERVMPGHKAQGLVAQTEFERRMRELGESAGRKAMPGCWIVARKSNRFFAQRTCIFVDSSPIRNSELDLRVRELTGSSRSQRLWSALSGAGFDVLQCFGTYTERPTPSSLDWKTFRYSSSSDGIEALDSNLYFGSWLGRGYVKGGKSWTPETKALVEALDEDSLSRLSMPQVFYTEFFKGRFGAAPLDPYDVDGFVIGDAGDVFPIEIKEKFPFSDPGFGSGFGIDAGRLLMMLRLVLPRDGNSFYVVREVEPGPERKFLAWKILRLDELLMKCSWNTRTGGPPMASTSVGPGASTHTVLVPAGAFRAMSAADFTEEALHGARSMSESAKSTAAEFLKGVSLVPSIRS